MTWPFDPWNLRPRPPTPRDVARSWADVWSEATRWWVEPASSTAEALATSNERLLAELAEGVMRRFEGRRVTIPLAGRDARGLVDWIRLRRGDGRSDGRLEARDVEWDGWRFDRLLVSAGSVGVESPPSARLVVKAVEVVGGTPLDRLVAWVDARIPDWTLEVDDAGRVEASRPELSLAVAVEPAVSEDRVVLELRAVRWRRVCLRLPMWLRVTRTFDLPALPRRMSVADARRVGARVEFRVTVPVVEQPVDLARVRDAIGQAAPIGMGVVRR